MNYGKEKLINLEKAKRQKAFLESNSEDNQVNLRLMIEPHLEFDLTNLFK